MTLFDELETKLTERCMHLNFFLCIETLKPFYVLETLCIVEISQVENFKLNKMCSLNICGYLNCKQFNFTWLLNSLQSGFLFNPYFIIIFFTFLNFLFTQLHFEFKRKKYDPCDRKRVYDGGAVETFNCLNWL